MRIAVYGGSFNPPHLGHEAVVETVREEIKPDVFLVIPDCRPPHKELSSNAPTPEERLEMCRLAFGDTEGVAVSDMEINRGGRSYTSDTIAQLRELYGDAEIYLVIGSDMLLSFTEWHDYEYILDNCTLAVVTRFGDDLEALERASLGRTVILEHTPVVISSSEIRENLSEQYLSESVYSYIMRKGLYK